MRLLQKIEQSFTTALVDNTTQIVRGSKPVAEKVATLWAHSARQTMRLQSLQRLVQRTGADSPKAEKLQKAISMRQKAADYLAETAKFLLHKEKYPSTLRQRPSFFASPNWNQKPEEEEKASGPEFPYMEFSS